MKHLYLLICVFTLLFISQVNLVLYPQVGILVTSAMVILLLFLTIYDIFDLYAEVLFAYLSVIPFLSLFVISLFIQSLIVRDIFIFASLLIISELFYSFLPLKNKLYHLRSFKFIILSLIYAVLFGILAGLYLPHSNLPLFLSALIILLSSVSEALYFQGLIQNAVCNLINPITGVIFTIILYGFFHSTTNNEQLIIIILYGLCGTLLYFFWKNIYLVMIFYLLFQITFYFISHNILFF